MAAVAALQRKPCRQLPLRDQPLAAACSVTARAGGPAARFLPLVPCTCDILHLLQPHSLLYVWWQNNLKCLPPFCCLP
jgi:hypothetical protein